MPRILTDAEVGGEQLPLGRVTAYIHSPLAHSLFSRARGAALSFELLLTTRRLTEWICKTYIFTTVSSCVLSK
jgi:hypothetical protein